MRREKNHPWMAQKVFVKPKRTTEDKLSSAIPALLLFLNVPGKGVVKFGNTT
jgi:hypothetical protein